MNDAWQEFYRMGLVYAGRTLGAAIILAVGWLGVRFVVMPLRRLLERGRFDPSVASFLVNSARAVIVVVIVLGVLQQMGVQTASLLTLLGAIGLAIGIALQGFLANFASGLLVLSYRMVRVGDLVEIGETRGRVTELLPFHVVVVTPDNQRVSLPNTLLTGSAVRNLSALPSRRVQWSFPLMPKDNLAAVKETMLAHLQTDPRILSDPPPHAYVKEWSQDKRILVIEVWTSTANYQGVQDDLLEPLGARLEEMRQGR
jgi:small conductance mechanosensitive channel